MKTSIKQNERIIEKILKYGRELTDRPEKYTMARMLTSMLSDIVYIVDKRDKTIVSYGAYFEEGSDRIGLHDGTNREISTNDKNFLWLYARDFNSKHKKG